MTFESLFSEYESLRNAHARLLEEIQLKEERGRHYETYIERLEEMVRLLRYGRFAQKSERMQSTEQMVFNEFEVEAANSPDPDPDEADQLDLIEVGSHKRKKPKRKKLPKDLPREEVVIELPESERFCPHDGTALKVIGFEESEKVDVIPMQIKVIKTIRHTYACPCCESFMRTAPVPPQPIPKGLPTAGTLAFIGTSKFCDGLSLYHVEKMFERNGVEISRGSMVWWTPLSRQNLAHNKMQHFSS